MGQEFGPRLLSPEPLSEPMLLPGLDLPVTGPLVMPRISGLSRPCAFDPSSPPTQEEMAAILPDDARPGFAVQTSARAGTRARTHAWR